MNHICVVHALVERSQPHVILRDIECFAQLRDYGDVTFVNALGSGLPDVSAEEHDLVIFADSFMVNRSSPIWPELVRRVKKLIGTSRHRALFLQDDYTRHDVTVNFARKHDIEVFSVFSEMSDLYAAHGVVARPWLIGFADNELDIELRSFRIPWSDRSRDIGQRVNRTSVEFGLQGRMKASLAMNFHVKMLERGFISDVSTDEEDRFFGDGWFRFLADSRATIGRHSGASLITESYRDSVRARAVEFSYPNLPFEQQVCRYKRPSMREINMLAPSPRMFESASLEVVQVLETSDLDYGIEPWESFVPIAPDLSDIDTVASFLRSSEAPEMATRCRRALFGDKRWRRETWLRKLAENFQLERSSVEGKLRMPIAELEAYSRLSGIEDRVDRRRALRILKSSGTVQDESPIESLFRWRPAFDKEARRDVWPE